MYSNHESRTLGQGKPLFEDSPELHDNVTIFIGLVRSKPIIYDWTRQFDCDWPMEVENAWWEIVEILKGKGFTVEGPRPLQKKWNSLYRTFHKQPRGLMNWIHGDWEVLPYSESLSFLLNVPKETKSFFEDEKDGFSEVWSTDSETEEESKFTDKRNFLYQETNSKTLLSKLKKEKGIRGYAIVFVDYMMTLNRQYKSGEFNISLKRIMKEIMDIFF